MLRGAGKVVVGREQREVVTQAQLRDRGVDGADLHARAAATVAQFATPTILLERLGAGVRRRLTS